MEQNVIQISGEITTNVDVCVKKFMYVKNIMFGILLYVLVKWKTFSKYYGWNFCDEIIDVKKT